MKKIIVLFICSISYVVFCFADEIQEKTIELNNSDLALTLKLQQIIVPKNNDDSSGTINYNYILKIKGSGWTREIWNKELLSPEDFVVSHTNLIHLIGAIKIDDAVYVVYMDSGIILIEALEMKALRWVVTNTEVIPWKNPFLGVPNVEFSNDETNLKISFTSYRGDEENYIYPLAPTFVKKIE